MHNACSHPLTALSLNENERNDLRQRITYWAENVFLPKFVRRTDRTEKCRLVASVERHTFDDDLFAMQWNKFKFEDNHTNSKEKEVLFGLTKEDVDKQRKQIGEKMKATYFQKDIIDRNSEDLKDIYICKNDTKDEETSTKWQLKNNSQKIIIGGEAAIFEENIDNLVAAVRVHAFDPYLFSENPDAPQLKLKTRLLSDYAQASTGDMTNENVVPFHPNVVRNYANIEIFHCNDEKNEDCLGWITIMERCDNDNLHTALKNELLELEDRKTIARGILSAFEYLGSIGITHCDKKPQNFLLLTENNCIVPKLCDFGLLMEKSGRESFREMGYARRGSKYRNKKALLAGTPGFFDDSDNYFYYIFCDWSSSWALLYRPIDKKEQNQIDEIIKKCDALKIVPQQKRSLQNRQLPQQRIARSAVLRKLIEEVTEIIRLPEKLKFKNDDEQKLKKTLQMSSIRFQFKRIEAMDLQDLTKNVPDQNCTELCVPISVAELIRHAMKKYLSFEDREEFTTEEILITLTMKVFPRSMAGLNRNPNKKEINFQTNDIETLLERMSKKTFLNLSGWDMVREQGSFSQPPKSMFQFKKVQLHPAFDHKGPLSVTGAYKLKPYDKPFYHQMNFDHVNDDVDKNYYVLSNTLHQNEQIEKSHLRPDLPIKRDNLYANVWDKSTGYTDNGVHTPLIPIDQIECKKWYLLPFAYEIILVPF